jgi:hypothetical protein
MHKFEKLLAKKMKDGKKMSDNEKEAKSGVLSEMKDMASKMMGDKVKGIKKVTVASNSDEGVKKGLEKAKELLGQESEESPEMEESETEESSEESMDDCCEQVEELGEKMDASQLDEAIQKLMELKKQKEQE